MPRILFVVPYRAGPSQEHRAEHLRLFLEHMPSFLSHVDHHLLVVEQGSTGKFNRGSCLNAGVRWAQENGVSFDAVCFHDVDLLPENSMAEAYSRTNVHLARSWKRYDTDTYLGGALTLDASVFEAVNGFPNLFHGHGGEDDELRDRLEGVVSIQRVRDGAYRDLENMCLTEKLSFLRDHREVLKCNDKWEVRDAYRLARSQGQRVEGLIDLVYKTVRVNTHDTHTHIHVLF